MSNYLRFSIVIPFYNEARKLPTLIESLVNQEFDKDNYEIVLVDNLSTDGSCSTASKALAGFPHAQLVTCNDFRSSYAARNVGWRAARGEYIVFIDADCVPDKSLLKNYDQCINSVDADSVGVYAGSILAHARDNISNVERYSADRKFLNQDSAVKGWAYRPFAQTANAMFPRSVLDSVGGFNARMTSGGDGELCWRIFDATGRRLEYAKDAVVFHWHREDIGDLFAQFEKYGVGRFQQSGMVPGFDKGLVGITKGTLVERLQSLEQEILSSTDSSAKDKLLWALYDVVARVGNVYGYLSAKSQLTDRRHPTVKSDPFAAPNFLYACSVCGVPNPDLSPTFAPRVDTSENSHLCSSCGATEITRLSANLQSAGIGRFSKNTESVETTYFRPESTTPGIIDRTKLYVLSNPSNFAEALLAVRSAYDIGFDLLVVVTAETHAALSQVRPVYLNAALNNSGIFQDKYTGVTYWYWLVECRTIEK